MFNALKERPMELHYAFFGKPNVERIHFELMRRVKQKTNLVIDRQSDTALAIIMKYIFEDNAQYGPDKVDEQVQTHNEIVLAKIVPMATAAVKMHLAYLRDSTTLFQPLEHAAATSVTGTAQNEFTSYF